MRPVLFNFNADGALAGALAVQLDADLGEFEQRSFPDGETYLRFDTDCRDREAILLGGLDRPDDKILPLILAAETLRDSGASRVGLISPYLAYMRQDICFRRGEGISAVYFAKLVSRYFDWLTTVDPHLHRIASLDDVYAIPTQVVHAAPFVADWVKNRCTKPLLIGPDSESEQWVADIATRAAAPYVILEKIRSGDHDVRISIPRIDNYQKHQPVLVDDIISTGHTMIAVLKHLAALDMPAPVCIGVHGIFAGDGVAALKDAGAATVVTCNTIAHPSNDIDISTGLAQASADLLGR